MKLEMNRDRKNALSIYIVTMGGLLLQIVPSMQAQLVSLIILGGLLIGLPILRRHAPEGSFVAQHSRYLFRTLWIWSIILTLGMAIAGYLISRDFTYAEVLEIITHLANMDTSDPGARRFMNVAAAATAPAMLYLFWRLGRGVVLILKDCPMKNPKTLL